MCAPLLSTQSAIYNIRIHIFCNYLKKKIKCRKGSIKRFAQNVACKIEQEPGNRANFDYVKPWPSGELHTADIAIDREN